MNSRLPYLLLVQAFFFLTATSPVQEKPVFISGQTMGTTWKAIYFDGRQRNFQREVDSLLVLLNASINHWDKNSEVSRFNKSKDGIKSTTVFLKQAIETGKKIHKASGGAFDMTVMPLVNGWGFGPGKAMSMSRVKVDSMLAFTGFDKVTINGDNILKSDPRVQLDFGGIGQGFAVDVISDFLRSKGLKDFLVELGGEGYASGKNREFGRSWQIGILDPNSTRDDQQMKLFVRLENKSFTTSGNYFNYRIIDGRKYGHTLDPTTGYPVQSELLSVTVFSERCIDADAWATAFMVMGFEKSLELLETRGDLDIIFILSDTKDGVRLYMSENIKERVIQIND